MYTSSFSFNITCCLSRSFKRFIKDFLKCSRTNKKLFAKNFDFVREQFEKSSRTILILFANSFLRFLLHLSYYSFSIIFRAFILQLNTHCVSLTIYTFVPHKMYYCASQYILSSKWSSTYKNQKKYGIKRYLKYAFDTILYYDKMLLSYSISCSYQSLIGKNSMTSQP